MIESGDVVGGSDIRSSQPFERSQSWPSRFSAVAISTDEHVA